MQDLGAIAMITALAWPIIGGALVGLIGGIVRRDGLGGTLLNIILGAAFGYALVLGFIMLAQGAALPDNVSMALTIGLPILGGLIALGVRGLFKG